MVLPLKLTWRKQVGVTNSDSIKGVTGVVSVVHLGSLSRPSQSSFFRPTKNIRVSRRKSCLPMQPFPPQKSLNLGEFFNAYVWLDVFLRRCSTKNAEVLQARLRDCFYWRLRGRSDGDSEMEDFLKLPLVYLEPGYPLPAALPIFRLFQTYLGSL